MQLNPARGRKRVEEAQIHHRMQLWVYAAQPREGTETQTSRSFRRVLPPGVYAAQPREETETGGATRRARSPSDAVYAAQPREGTETREWLWHTVN